MTIWSRNGEGGATLSAPLLMPFEEGKSAQRRVQWCRPGGVAARPGETTRPAPTGIDMEECDALKRPLGWHWRNPRRRSMGFAPENQVRIGLTAGGRRIRTIGPSRRRVAAARPENLASVN